MGSEKPVSAKTEYNRKRAARLKAVFDRKGRKPLGMVTIWKKKRS